MRITFTLILLSLTACDGAPGVDASLADAASDAPSDAGSTFDPAASFEPVVTTGEGPWVAWGFMVIPLAQDRALVFGGTNASDRGGQVFDTMWTVTVTAGAVSATRIEATGPSPRYCGCATYDPARDVVVVFGGRDLTGPSLAAATWELALGTNTWTQVPAAVQSTGTIGCAMAYAASTDAVYLFGGAGVGGPTNETYRYDATAGTWVLLDTAGPLARYDAVLLPPRMGEEGFLLFGGSYGATGSGFYADLWRFDPSSEVWTEIAMEGSGPTGRRTAWVVRDPERDGLYVGFGYDLMLEPLGDFWYADLAAGTWTALPLPSDGPVPRGFSPALPGGADTLGTMIGGNTLVGPTSDAWQLVRPPR